MTHFFRPQGRRAPRGRKTHRVALTLLALALLLAGLLPAGVSAAPIGGWTETGAPPAGHLDQPAALLGTGKVLAAGGLYFADFNDQHSNKAMLYDPASGAWNPTGSLNTGRYGHTLTLLANGKVLASGGSVQGGTTKTAELYDPVTGLWSDTGMMFGNRKQHTAVRLANGKVLVAGGEYSNNALQSAEIYDPATNGWSLTGPMVSARSGHTAVLLGSGKVLVVGGQQDDDVLASAELYNPATNTWSSTGSLTVPRQYHAMTVLNNGMVLVSGGVNVYASDSTAAVERYDPVTGAWTTLPSMQTPRAFHSMTRLPSGDVLVAGGYFSGEGLASAEIYSSTGNSWYLTGGMTIPRLYQSAVLLNSGKVLAFSGYDLEGLHSQAMNGSADLYDPAQAVTTFSLGLAKSGPGTVVSYPPGGVYPSGTTVVVRATPDPGEVFVGWHLDGSAQGWRSALAVTMDGPHAVEATFMPRPSFPDVLNGTAAEEAIEQLAARGIIKGYGDGRFGPNDTTLRAQMAALICRAMGWDAENHGNPFTDGNGIDANLWRNIGTLSYYDVSHGYGDGRFGPNDIVTKAQTISFITRAMVKKGYWPMQPDDPTRFTDVPASSGHRQDLITYYTYAGPLPDQQGYDDPFASWNSLSTRGWFARALWTVLDDQFGDDFLP